MNAEERQQWFFSHLNLKDINANQGKNNCGHCAFRLNDYIREGRSNEGLKPVAIQNARLFFSPVLSEKGAIVRSSTTDRRIAERCRFPIFSQGVQYSFDLTQEGGDSPVLDLTYEWPSQHKEKQQTRLMRVDVSQNSLTERLKMFSRRASDGAAFGFIILTHKEDVNKFKLGHILNFFVDKNDIVYFVDAQDATITHELSREGYLSDVFYVQSAPNDPVLVKQEKIDGQNDDAFAFQDALAAIKVKEEVEITSPSSPLSLSSPSSIKTKQKPGDALRVYPL